MKVTSRRTATREFGRGRDLLRWNVRDGDVRLEIVLDRTMKLSVKPVWFTNPQGEKA
jgi:hypothetical protein